MIVHHESGIDDIRDRHRGESVLVIGCGPSAVDSPALAARMTSIGTSTIGMMLQPDYYVIIDPVAYEQFGDMLQRAAGTRILPQWIDAPCDVRVHVDMANEVGFSRDVLFHGRSVGYLSVGLAHVMGAKEIHLIGVDGYQPDEPTYFWEPSEAYQARSRQLWTKRFEPITTGAYAIAAERMAAAGGALVNHSPRSFLSRIPHVRNAFTT